MLLVPRGYRLRLVPVPPLIARPLLQTPILPHPTNPTKSHIMDPTNRNFSHFSAATPTSPHRSPLLLLPSSSSSSSSSSYEVWNPLPQPHSAISALLNTPTRQRDPSSRRPENAPLLPLLQRPPVDPAPGPSRAYMPLPGDDPCVPVLPAQLQMRRCRISIMVRILRGGGGGRVLSVEFCVRREWVEEEGLDLWRVAREEDFCCCLYVCL